MPNIDISKVKWDNNQDNSDQSTIDPSKVSWDNSNESQDNTPELNTNPISSNQTYGGYSPQFQLRNKSPLTLADNLKLSFANPSAQADYLKSKFPFVSQDGKGNFSVGTSALDARLISPDGITNDIVGKLTRHLGDFNVIAQSIAGGSVAGIPGAMAGGATGELSNKAIGSMLGVNNEDPESQAQDIVISAMASGLGEGAGQLVNKVGKATVKGGMQMLENSMNKTATSPEAQGFVKQRIANLFNFFSGQPVENTLGVFDPALKQAGKTQVESVLGGTNGTDSHLEDISHKILNSFYSRDAQLGQAVGDSKQAMINAAGMTKFATGDLQATLLNSMRDLRILDDNNIYNPSHGLGSTAKRLIDTFKFLGGNITRDADGAMGEFIPNFKPTSTVQDLLSLKTRFGNIYDGINPKLKNVAYGLDQGGIDSNTGAQKIGLRQTLENIADSLGVKSYKVNNANFSNFQNVVDGLKATGVDVSNPRSTENLVKNIASGSPSVRNALNNSQAVLGDNAPNFVNEIRRYDIAKSFRNDNIRMFRFGLASGLIGMGSQHTPIGEAGRILGAGAIASPAGNRTLLLSGSKIMNSFPQLSPDMQGFLLDNPITGRIAAQTTARTLSNLLKNRNNQS